MANDYDLVNATTDHILQLDGVVFADSSTVQSEVRAHLVANGAFAAGAILATYDTSGGDTFLAMISTADGVANNGKWDDAVVTDILKLTAWLTVQQSQTPTLS